MVLRRQVRGWQIAGGWQRHSVSSTSSMHDRDSASVIHCPDCGGVVGATQTTEAGPPCTCFGIPGALDALGNGAESVSDPSGTQVLDAPKNGPKVCCKCGKD